MVNEAQRKQRIIGSGGRAVERRTVNRGDSGSIPPTTVSKLRHFRFINGARRSEKDTAKNRLEPFRHHLLLFHGAVVLQRQDHRVSANTDEDVYNQYAFAAAIVVRLATKERFVSWQNYEILQ